MIKTYADLVFEAHKSRPMFDMQAVLFFDNGYGISVVTGASAYGGLEAAVIHKAPTEKAPNNFYLVYDTDITDDVLGYLTPDRVTEIMAQIAALPPRPST